MTNARCFAPHHAQFEARIIEAGDRDEGTRIIVTRLHEGEICLELQREGPNDTIKKLGFVLLSNVETSALADALTIVAGPKGTGCGLDCGAKKGTHKQASSKRAGGNHSGPVKR